MQEPKPEWDETEHQFDGPNQYRLAKMGFDRRVSQWNSRNIKPKLEWKRFEDVPKIVPKIGEHVLLLRKDGTVIPAVIQSNRGVNVFCNGYESWADKDTYDKQLEEFNYWQKRYDGWKLLTGASYPIFIKGSYKFFMHDPCYNLVDLNNPNIDIRLPTEYWTIEFTDRLFDQILKETE